MAYERFQNWLTFVEKDDPGKLIVDNIDPANKGEQKLIFSANSHNGKSIGLGNF